MTKNNNKVRSADTAPLRHAWRRSYPGLFFVFVFSALINVLKLAIPLYIFQLLDRVLSSRSIDTLIVLTLITVCAVLTCTIAEFIRRWMLIKWGAWIERSFSRQLFLAGLENKNEPRAGKYLKDLGQIRKFVSGTGAIAWLDVVWAPAFVVAAYLVHPLIALIAVISIAVMLILGILSEVMTRRARSAATQATRERGDWLATAEQSVSSVSALNMGPHLGDRWQTSTTERLDENLRTRMTSLATSDTMRFVEHAQRIASYGIGVWLVILGQLSIGGMIVAAVLGRMAASAFRRAMINWRHFASTAAAYHRIRSKLTAPQGTNVPPLPHDATQSLHIEDLGHRYTEQLQPVFRHLSLSLEPGELLCIIGPSGSGKSTITSILTGNLEPKFGTVRLGEVVIGRYGDDRLDTYLSYLEQEPRLFKGTVAENIAGLGDANPEDVSQAAKLVGIHDIIVRLPEGYETPVDGTRGTLSGGERKRIALARAFYCKPRLLVLDEPEANLDKASRLAMSKALRAIKRAGAIVVVTAQSDTLIPIADKAIKLNAGVRPQTYLDTAKLRNKRSRRRSVPKLVASK